MTIAEIVQENKSLYLSPSLLACNFANLQADLAKVEQDADMYHFDVMDGMFVPNISFGFPLMEAVRQVSNKPLDMHLMIEAPERYFERFKLAGANSITFHLEASKHPDQALRKLKDLGLGAAVAINPGTPVCLLQNLLPLCDMVLIMSVNPGYGGQKFIDYSLDKVRELKAEISRRQLNCLIEVDGGVKLHNAKELIKAGASVLVAGTEVFKHTNPAACLKEFRKIAELAYKDEIITA